MFFIHEPLRVRIGASGGCIMGSDRDAEECTKLIKSRPTGGTPPSVRCAYPPNCHTCSQGDGRRMHATPQISALLALQISALWASQIPAHGYRQFPYASPGALP